MENGPKIDTESLKYEIEIPLPGKMPSGHPSQGPRILKIELLKQWVNIIATTAALVTAVAAVFKPNDPVNRASYGQLKLAIEQLQANDLQRHEDIVALRNYLEGYMNKSSIPNNVPSSLPVIPALSPSASTHSSVLPPPLPHLHAQPSINNIPNYDDLKSTK